MINNSGKNIIKRSYKYFIIIIILLIFLFFSHLNFFNYKSINLKNLEALNQKITYYKNKEGQEIAAKISLQGEKNALKLLVISLNDSTKQLNKIIKTFKNVSAAIQTKTILKIDSIEIPYYIKGNDFNKPFEIKKEFYSFSGNSTNLGLFINSIIIPNKQSIVIGDKKTSFFKNKYQINVINSNPYIKTTNLESFVYKEKKKRFGIGLQFGYGINSLRLSPYLGIGLNYSLIQF